MCACKQGTCPGDCPCGCNHTVFAPSYDASEWKPGDVAALPNGRTAVVDGQGRFVYGVGNFKNTLPNSWNGQRGRRLVVIDPEDAEQVERFDDLLSRFVEGNEVPDYEGTQGATRAALREFARPTPRIEEPSLFGAVVEDARGVRWVRSYSVEREVAWITGEHRAPWSEIKPVRILSPGVTS